MYRSRWHAQCLTCGASSTPSGEPGSSTFRAGAVREGVDQFGAMVQKVDETA
jgi:hypothetical protein